MQSVRQTILYILCAIACVLPAQAIDGDMQASLITCYPGPEIYELVGHEAIRIRGVNPEGERIDSVWNYGVFDFNTPGFVYRFVKGETDYMVWGYPFAWFMPQYTERGSEVVEQDLDFTREETLDLLMRLRENALEENRTYRYNYVRDNCSTRVVAMVDSAAAPRRIIYPDTVVYTSFRDAMRSYHRNYPWYQFGIDMALGSGIDTPINSHEEMFAPLRLMQLASGAHFANGEPLIKSTRVLYPGREGSVLPPTPWYLTPVAVMWAILFITLGICIFGWLRRRMVRWWMSLFFFVLGIAGCFVWFLVFISSHESTSPNLLCLWLNPLQLIPAVCIWWRGGRPLAMAMCVVNIIVMIVIACIWPFQTQSANPAIFPLWGATFLLALTYALLYQKKASRYVGT